MKRLSGWDAVLLYSETPTVHMHTLKLAVIELDDLKGRHVRHRRVPQGHPRPAPQARPVPLPARRHPVQVPPPDVAGELRGRPRLPRPAVPGRQPRRPPPTGRTRSAGSPAPRWTAASRCGRCTSSRVWPTAASRCSARSTTRWPTASHRPTCWRGGWTCRPAAARSSTRTQPIPRRAGRAAALGVRRPHAPDRPAAGVMRYTAQGIGRVRKSSKKLSPELTRPFTPPPSLHEPPRRRAAQVRHRHARSRRRQGDGQTPRRHDQRHGARDLGRRTAQAVAEVRRPCRSPAIGLRPSEFRLLHGTASRATASPA